MAATHIPMIMDILDKIVPEDRKRKYSNRLIAKILVLLQLYGISYRSSARFFENHTEFLSLLGVHDIPSFQTISRKASKMLDLHEINASILDLIETSEENAAIDSFMVKTCIAHTAQRRRQYGGYKDPESAWCKGTNGWEYGRKAHISQDVDSTAIVDWIQSRGSIHDSRLAKLLIDSVRNHGYILMDAAYDASEIHDYVAENDMDPSLFDIFFSSFEDNIVLQPPFLLLDP